jgi:hypothetical protein
MSFKGPLVPNCLSTKLFNDSYFFSVLKGRIHPSVEEVYRVLDKVRSYYELTDSLSWGKYIGAAIQEADALRTGKSSWSFFLESSPIRPFALGEVVKEFRTHSGMNKGKPAFYCIQGVNARLLSLSPRARNAVCQVASQFNFLESESASYSPISAYTRDRSQGPQVSLGFLSSLIVRDFLFKDHKTQQLLQPLFADLSEKSYQGGYLMPTHIAKDRRTSFIEKLRANIASLSIFAQWGRSEVGSKDPVLQVFTAAPCFKGEDTPEPDSFGHQVCLLLVPVQYEIVAQIAVLRSLESRERIPLHFTLVGQGAFRNPESVMSEAFKLVLDTVNGFPIDVYFHGYTVSDVAKIKRNLPRGLEVKDMTADEFFSRPMPSPSKAAPLTAAAARVAATFVVKADSSTSVVRTVSTPADVSPAAATVAGVMEDIV